MRALLAPTDPFIKTEHGFLAADTPAGTNVTLTLENNDGLANQSYLVIGYEGNELCEMVQVNQAVTAGSNVRVASLKFPHQQGEPVTLYRYNQRKFYGATSATGVYTELTADGSPKDIQVDDPQGSTLECTDPSYAFFKATYFNATTNEETAIEDATATAGDESGRYTTLYAIRKHAGLAGNPRYSDLRLEVKRKQAENEINSVLAARYVLPLTEVPALLGQIAESLAAGYIDYEEFGKDGQGVQRLGEGRALLKAISTGRQLLIGADGTELVRQTNEGALSGYPNSVATDEAVFGMKDQY